MTTCPNCLGRAYVVETRHDGNGNTRRRFQCAECRYRWSEWNTQAPSSAAPQALDEAAIRDILTSTDGHAVIAERYSRSASTIGAIRRGEMHATVAPELPRWDRKGMRGIKRLCSNCIYWNDDRCDLGFPDPAVEGLGFAKDCNTYSQRAA